MNHPFLVGPQLGSTPCGIHITKRAKRATGFPLAARGLRATNRGEPMDPQQAATEVIYALHCIALYCSID